VQTLMWGQPPATVHRAQLDLEVPPGIVPKERCHSERPHREESLPKPHFSPSQDFLVNRQKLHDSPHPHETTAEIIMANMSH